MWVFLSFDAYGGDCKDRFTVFEALIITYFLCSFRKPWTDFREKIQLSALVSILRVARYDFIYFPWFMWYALNINWIERKCFHIFLLWWFLIRQSYLEWGNFTWTYMLSACEESIRCCLVMIIVPERVYYVDLTFFSVVWRLMQLLGSLVSTSGRQLLKELNLIICIKSKVVDRVNMEESLGRLCNYLFVQEFSLDSAHFAIPYFPICWHYVAKLNW